MKEEENFELMTSGSLGVAHNRLNYFLGTNLDYSLCAKEDGREIVRKNKVLKFQVCELEDIRSSQKAPLVKFSKTLSGFQTLKNTF